jgi:ABC-type transport system involved in multi-copper enzyme maturation permease subunit
VVAALAILASRWQIEPLHYLGVPAYFIGTAILGASVVGHEYTHRTLASMLALPVPRWRWWSAKLAILATMLATLMGLAMGFLPLDRGDQSIGISLFVLPPLVALFVTPWLTMATASPTAAAVLAFSAMGGSLALGEWIGVLRHGFTPAADAFRIAFMWWALGGLSLIGAVMGWRSFLTLEVPDPSGDDIQLPIGSRRGLAALTRRPALAALVGKELRLQQLSLVVAVIFSGIYVVVALTTRRVDHSLMVANVLLTFYVVVIPIVIGSAAVAEERRFGMLGAQLLLPVAVAAQWAVKATVTLALAVALGLLLPLALALALMTTAQPPPPSGVGLYAMAPQWFIFAGGFTAVALYMSTLARSGLRAMVLSIAAIPVLAYVSMEVAANGIGRPVFTAVYNARAPHAGRMVMFSSVGVGGWLFAVALISFVLFALVLAFFNFRRVDRSAMRVAAHAGIAVTVILAFTVALSVCLALAF